MWHMQTPFLWQHDDSSIIQRRVVDRHTRYELTMCMDGEMVFMGSFREFHLAREHHLREREK